MRGDSLPFLSAGTTLGLTCIESSGFANRLYYLCTGGGEGGGIFGQKVWWALLIFLYVCEELPQMSDSGQHSKWWSWKMDNCDLQNSLGDSSVQASVK